MGASLYTSLYPNDKPNVALLNIVSEELKGNETIKETYQLLNEKKSDNYNFVGYIEGVFYNTISWLAFCASAVAYAFE